MTATRPARLERLAAVGAFDETTQDEVFTDIFALGGFGDTGAAFLDLVERRQRDQPIMLGFTAGDAPVGGFQIARVNYARENVRDQLGAHLALADLRESGLAFKEALDFGLRLETPRSVSLKTFTDDRGERLVRFEPLTAPAYGFVAVADWRLKRPVPAQQTHAHAVLHLLTVLLALVLRDAGEQVLDKDGVGVFAELNRWRLKARTDLLDGCS